MSLALLGVTVGAALFGLVTAPASMRAIEATPPDPEDDPAPVPTLGPFLARTRLLAPVLAAVAAAVALRTGVHPVAAAHVVVAVGLVVLSVIDFDLFLLPKRLVYPLLAVAFFLLAVAALIEGETDPLVRALVCGVAAWAALGVLWVINPRGMGFGDVRLAAVIGLDLGWIGANQVVLGLFAAFVFAAVVGVALMATRKKGRRDSVPFGPFLAAGTLFVLLGGDLALGLVRH